MRNILLLASLVAINLSLISLPALAKQDKGLPPGLQKKLARGGELPPGWQKKLAEGEILDRHIYTHGTILEPVDDLGVVTVQVEDRVVRLIESTMEIIEILR